MAWSRTISPLVSLATVRLETADAAARWFYREAVFPDGIDKAAGRERHARNLLDNLNAELRRALVAA